MIQQRVKLVKSQTDDGSYKTPLEVGFEFWVECNTVAMRTWKSRHSGEQFQMLSIKVVIQGDIGLYVPVEVLEWTSDFQVTG